MRVDPECVYLRLEPAAHLINHKTGAVRSVPCVEIHWKDGNKWARRSFVATEDVPTLGAVLGQLGEWADSHPDLETALDSLRSPRG